MSANNPVVRKDVSRQPVLWLEASQCACVRLWIGHPGIAATHSFQRQRLLHEAGRLVALKSVAVRVSLRVSVLAEGLANREAAVYLNRFHTRTYPISFSPRALVDGFQASCDTLHRQTSDICFAGPVFVTSIIPLSSIVKRIGQRGHSGASATRGVHSLRKRMGSSPGLLPLPVRNEGIRNQIHQP